MKLLPKAEQTVRGTHSTSAVNQSYQPYPGVSDMPPHHAYSASAGIVMMIFILSLLFVCLSVERI